MKEALIMGLGFSPIMINDNIAKGG